MTEAAASFTGNLTDQPEVHQSEGGITRATFRVAVFARHDSKPGSVAAPGRAGETQVRPAPQEATTPA